MNKLFSTTIHRMPRGSGGIRWSSYVGDVRCMGHNLSKSYSYSYSASSSYTTTTHQHKLHNNNNNNSSHLGGCTTYANASGTTTTRRNKTTKVSNKTTTRCNSSLRSLNALSRSLQNRNTAPHERLLVLGSGVAGCATALTAAKHGLPVTILHAGNSRDDCNSYWAQGGVIYRNYRLREDEAKKGGNKDER